VQAIYREILDIKEEKQRLLRRLEEADQELSKAQRQQATAVPTDLRLPVSPSALREGPHTGEYQAACHKYCESVGGHRKDPEAGTGEPTAGRGEAGDPRDSATDAPQL
jgi:hypothetical protein